MTAILGPRSGGILTSGDAAQDRAEQAEFARLARTKHRLEISSSNPSRAILAIGDEDWPFPVPIVRAGGKWSFDVSETPAEMHARRIGANELDAIEICHGYLEAQTKYASEDRDKDGMLKYAARLMSAPGRRDGLYWDGEGPLIPAGLAQAEWRGLQKERAKPYHGYYFRVLDGQGVNARWSAQLFGQRQADRRIRAGGVAGRIRSHRHSQLRGESGRRGLRERYRARSGQPCAAHYSLLASIPTARGSLWSSRPQTWCIPVPNGRSRIDRLPGQCYPHQCKA